MVTWAGSGARLLVFNLNTSPLWACFLLGKTSTALQWVPVRNEWVRLLGAFRSMPGTAEALRKHW